MSDVSLHVFFVCFFGRVFTCFYMSDMSLLHVFVSVHMYIYTSVCIIQTYEHYTVNSIPLGPGLSPLSGRAYHRHAAMLFLTFMHLYVCTYDVSMYIWCIQTYKHYRVNSIPLGPGLSPSCCDAFSHDITIKGRLTSAHKLVIGDMEGMLYLFPQTSAFLTQSNKLPTPVLLKVCTCMYACMYVCIYIPTMAYIARRICMYYIHALSMEGTLYLFPQTSAFLTQSNKLPTPVLLKVCSCMYVCMYVCMYSFWRYVYVCMYVFTFSGLGV
jgi:hypothetical protein